MAYDHHTTNSGQGAIPVLAPFHFEGKPVRAIEIDGGIWFVGKDVAARLGYADPTTAIRSHCRGVQKLHPILDTRGRYQEVRILSEADVLRLIIGSKLPGAERFERWVFEEVLPTIRRTGRYEAVPQATTLPKSQTAIPRDRVSALDYHGQTIRLVERRGAPWFVVRDVCTAIGMVDPSTLAAKLEPGEKDLYPFPSATGAHEMLIVSEIGLQVLLLRRRGVTTPGTDVYRFWYWIKDQMWPAEADAGPGLIPLTGDFQVGIYEMPGSDRKQLRATMPADMALPAMRHLLSGIEGAA